MAIEFFDSLGMYGGLEVGMTQVYDTASAPQLVNTAPLPRTGWCFVCNNSNHIEKAVSASATKHAGMRFYWQSGTPTAFAPLLYFREGTTTHLSIGFDNLAQLVVRRGTNTGTIIGTSVATISQGVAYYLSVEATISDGAGAVTVKLNGATVLAIAGADTNNAGASGVIDRVGWGYGPVGVNPGGSTTVRFQDIYIGDTTGSAPANAQLADVAADYLPPNGAGVATEWTPNAGANYAAVDEDAPDEDTTYVAAGSVGLSDLYTLTDPPVSVGTVLAVNHVMRIRKDDAGTAEVAPLLRSGGTTDEGTAIAAATNYVTQKTLYRTNPVTSAAWTIADVTGLEAGIRRTA